MSPDNHTSPAAARARLLALIGAASVDAVMLMLVAAAFITDSKVPILSVILLAGPTVLLHAIHRILNPARAGRDTDLY